jgi:protein-tyrosine phosphatase
VRGAGLREAERTAGSSDLTVYLLRRRPEVARPADRWVRWHDFANPASTADALAALREAYRRAATERVLVVCGHGVGRTGTALAVVAMMDGLSPEEAVETVRRQYHPRAVEMPWQRRWLRRVQGSLAP